MYKIGVSSCGFLLTEENFKLLSESKIDVIEISMPTECYDDINYSEVETLSKKYNVGLWSYHLPFYPFAEIDLSSTDKSVRESTIKYQTELIAKATNIGIKNFVVHASGEPIEDGEREEKLNCAEDSLDKLAEIAHKMGAVIAVEDIPRTTLGNSSDEIKRLISANDKLRVCFDTNHLLGEDCVEFIRKIGDKIITVHISDYDFVNEKHWLPGEGGIDWQKMLAAFKEVGYSGPWLYEMNLTIPKTINRERDLVFSDFYDNAMSIFANKKPQLLGVAKEV